jgi:predicted TIM-barrel fold metal-dependent hydrolase
VFVTIRRNLPLLAIVSALALSPADLSAQQAQGREQPTEADGSCAAGFVEIRPGRCRAPMVEPPSIVDYRPRSTLASAPTTMRPAKFPVIDWHGHPFAYLDSASSVRRLGLIMDSLNIRVMVAANSMTGDRLTRAIAVVNEVPEMRDRIRFLAGIDFRNVGPGWAERTVAQLERDAAAGAVGVGEIQQSLGITIRKTDGSRMQLDDADLQPVWAACARLGLPVFIHVGDPAQFFAPMDMSNERWLEMALFLNRQRGPDVSPPFETLMTERDNLFKNNPRTTFVLAHLGWNGNDLPRLGRLLDEAPNVYTEIGAVLYEIGRQPRGARAFFIKYQDRILFGKDSFQPEEYPYFWRVLETQDDYFEYYRGYHAFWRLYGIDLPDDVLRKIYAENALKLNPRMPRQLFP